MALIILKTINDFFASMTLIEYLSTNFFIVSSIYMALNWDKFKDDEDAWGDDSLFNDFVEIATPTDDDLDLNYILWYHGIGLETRSKYEYTEEELRLIRMFEINFTILTILSIILNFKQLYIGYNVVEASFFLNRHNF